MIDYEAELNEMISLKNLMNSYKLYFLKAIVVNASGDKRDFSFYEMACWMCAYSFSDVCSIGNRIRPLDKLYDVAFMAIEKENLMESSKISEVYDAVFNTKDKGLRRSVMSLCNFVPYRLLAYLVLDELKGKTDKQKNQIIEVLSRGDKRCVYAIYSISGDKKSIEVNPDWAIYIKGHRTKLIPWIEQKIDTFIWRKY